MTPAELKDWRLRVGLTQSQLARMLDVDNSTISKYEQNIRVNPPMLRFLTEAMLDKMLSPWLS